MPRKQKDLIDNFVGQTLSFYQTFKSKIKKICQICFGFLLVVTFMTYRAKSLQ